MQRKINRIEPRLPVQNMKTFSIVSPLSTHWRSATCREVECEAYVNGWKTTIDDSTNQGQLQRDFIRAKAGRHFTEHRNEAGLLVFDFPAGQECFARGNHRVRLDRQERFLIQGGDHRQRIGPVSEEKRPELWVERFAENQNRIIEVQERG